MKKQILYATLVICVVFVNGAFAGRTWFYNEITDSHGDPIGPPGDTAIGMRSGNAWPVVGYAGPSSGASCMLPGAWASGPISFGNGRFLDGATAPDSTVAFVSDMGQVVTLGKTGWSSSFCSSTVYSHYKNSIAFNGNSAPGVLYRPMNNNYLTLSMKSGGAWYASTVQESGGPPVFTDAYALDFDSYNQANVAFRYNDRLRYATKGVLTGNQWIFNSIEDAPVIGSVGQFDMALAADDVPYVLYNNGSSLNYAVYDRHSNSWMTNILDVLSSGSPPGGNFCVTADSSGGVGVAYVADLAGQNMLSYAYNNGSGWMGLDRLVEVRAEYTIGLAFDYENNPVISFVGMDGRMKIAYDPVPEPATLAVLALGFALIRRR
jgi:hypothetical protein